MKTKQKVDFIIDLLLLVIGMVTIFLGIIHFDRIRLVFEVIMILYAILNLIQYILTKKNKDYEGLYTFFASIVIAIIANFIDFSITNNLTLLLLSWVIIMSVIKFIKTDYYNDRKDRMWKIRIFTLVAFMLIGILTGISFNFTNDIKVLVLGYFFFIHGLLELIDPLTKYVLTK